jgi:hypothetical protein
MYAARTGRGGVRLERRRDAVEAEWQDRDPRGREIARALCQTAARLWPRTSELEQSRDSSLTWGGGARLRRLAAVAYV